MSGRCTSSSLYLPTVFGVRKVDLAAGQAWAVDGDVLVPIRSYAHLVSLADGAGTVAVVGVPVGAVLPSVTDVSRFPVVDAKGRRGRTAMAASPPTVSEVTAAYGGLALFDPRPTADNSHLAGRVVVAVEGTHPGLDAIASASLDPQHGFNRGFTSDAPTAIAAALHVPLPSADAVLVTVRPDPDSVGAMAVLALRRAGWDPSGVPAAVRRIELVSAADQEASGVWPGPRPSADPVDMVGPVAPVAALISDFRVPLPDRVAVMASWIATGDAPGLAGSAARVLAEAEAALQGTSVLVEGSGRVVSVESMHRLAMQIGYRHAPVVVARNPEFPGPDGTSHVKYTVAQYNTGVGVDFSALKETLNAAEVAAGGDPLWGGSGSILGSPQGQDSHLSLEQVVSLVSALAS